MIEIKQMAGNVHHMLIMINNCLWLVGDWFPIVIITAIKIMTIIEWNNWSLYKTTNWDGFVASIKNRNNEIEKKIKVIW